MLACGVTSKQELQRAVRQLVIVRFFSTPAPGSSTAVPRTRGDWRGVNCFAGTVASNLSSASQLAAVLDRTLDTFGTAE